MAKQVEEASPALAEDITPVPGPKNLLELRKFVLDKLDVPAFDSASIWKKLSDIEKLIGSMIIMNKIDIGSTIEREHVKAEASISGQYIRLGQYGSRQYLMELEQAKKDITRIHDHYNAMNDNIMAFKFLLNDIRKDVMVMQDRDLVFLQIALKTLDTLKIVPDVLIEMPLLESSVELREMREVREEREHKREHKEEAPKLAKSEEVDLSSLSLIPAMGVEEPPVVLLSGHSVDNPGE